MKKVLLEYCSIVGYIIVGLVFGLCFFLLFLNFYHYNEVNYYYYKNEDDKNLSLKLRKQLKVIEDNINSFDFDSYSGNEDIYNLSDMGSRLDLCVKKINNSDLFKLLDKEKILISDVYNLQQSYEEDIVNSCLIKQLHGLNALYENNEFKIDSLEKVLPFMELNIMHLKDDNNYVKNNIKNNSSYYFSNNSSKLSVFNMTRDSYYEVISSYKKSINFIENVSVFYKNIVIGG